METVWAGALVQSIGLVPRPGRFISLCLIFFNGSKRLAGEFRR
jgi:hypothetical protein